uniref:Uncharacterized protein n=1 Tax=Cyprinus carpio TaxID=7962 RepID=A0A8C2F0E8_CYPCA
MCNVHDNQQGGGRDHDELQRPQSDVRDGEEVVVAYAVAAGLLGVAGEMRFLVAPHTLRRHHKNQDPENEEDRQPNSPNAGGMSVRAADHGHIKLIKSYTEDIYNVIIIMFIFF